MFSAFQALILGIVQGLTEFLPVSSSAHLVLVPWLFHWKDQGLAFDVALHMGTLLALLIYYWRNWIEMLSSLVNGDRTNRTLLLKLIIASIPGAIFGVLLEKKAETVFRSPFHIAIALGVLGIALWYFDRVTAQRRTIGEITYIDAILIGLSQAFAIIPGVSRSGATITTARILAVKREDAANFSFLMATPIIAGAGLFEGRHMLARGLTSDVLVGFAAAAVFGLMAIALMIPFVRVRSYGVFAWYRVIVAIAVIAIFFTRG